jgi:type II secretory pathway component PulF
VLAIDIFYLLAKAWTHQAWFQIRFLRHLFEYYWYSLWVLQSQSGIDAAQIAANLRDLLPSAIYRHHSRVCQRHLEDGKSLLYSLSQAELILTSTLKQVLLVGEKSGELINYLKHHLTLEEQRIEIVIQAFYEWLPRIYYVLALGVVLDVFV